MVLSHRFRRSLIVVLGPAFVTVLISGWLLGADWQITQLTDNTFDDQNAKISGGYAVWEGWDGHDWEIFFYDGSVTQLTNNDYDDTYPEICGDRVAWVGDVASGVREVFLYDHGGVTQLTYSGGWSMPPHLSDVDVVWTGADATSSYVYQHTSAGTRTLPYGTGGGDPFTDGSRVVYSGDDGDSIDIFVFDGTNCGQITDTVERDQYPRMSGNNIVWEDFDSWGNREVYFYDGSTVTMVSGPDAEDDSSPRVSGSYMVWRHWEYLSDYEVRFYDHETGTTKQLTYDRKNDLNAEIDGSLIVWESSGTAGIDLMVYDIEEERKTELVRDSEIVQQPDISENMIVWHGSDGSDTEIFLAVLDTEPDIPGDLNGDGMVGSADLDIVRGNWLASVSPGDLSMGDPSGDGLVSSADLDIVRGNWCAGLATVPEPASAVLLLTFVFGVMAVFSRRRAGE